jgi:hypothetical protein
MFIANQKFEHPTQPSSIELGIVNVRVIILMKQDDDNTDWEISNEESKDSGQSTLSCNIEQDDWDIR